MKQVRSIGAPPSGVHWSMGSRYMQRISKPDAASLLAPHPLPRMGYETDAATAGDEWSGRHRLTVQNISGHFYLACPSAQWDAWPALFGVTVKGAK